MKGRLILVPEDRVVLRRKSGHDAHPQAIFRHVGQARRVAGPRAALRRQLAAVEHNRPSGRPHQSGHRGQHFRLSVARDSRDAHDLPRPQGKAHVLHPRHSEAVAHFEAPHLQANRPGTRRSLVHPQEHGASDHLFGQFGRRGVSGGHFRDDRPLPHHRHPVGDRHDFTQLVGDKDDRFPLGAQPAEHPEKLVRLLRRQHRRRLVQNQDICLAIERLEDLHPLLQTDGQVFHRYIQGRLEAVIPAQPFQFRPSPVQAAGQPRPALDSENDVFQHGEILHQHEMLVDHADAGGDRLVGAPQVDRPPVNPDLARVRGMKSVDDVHQRRLPGSVLANQAVHRARGDRKGHSPIGVDHTKAFVDSAQLKRRGRGG